MKAAARFDLVAASHFMPFKPRVLTICNACKGTLQVVGTSGAMKDCPRCVYPVITAQREARDKRRFLRGAWNHSRARGRVRFLLIAMSSNVDASGICALTVPRLCFLCGCSSRTLKQDRAELVALGEVVRVESSGGSGIGGVYRVRLLGK